MKRSLVLLVLLGLVALAFADTNSNTADVVSGSSTVAVEATPTAISGVTKTLTGATAAVVRPNSGNKSSFLAPI